MELILKYFPNLTSEQIHQFEQLLPLYRDWNQKINVISRKDIDNLYLHHVLHSLSIAKYIQFKQGTKILDLGTGGGFPGVPLAILFPEVSFQLVDSINKKLDVIRAISEEIGLKNVTTQHTRVEEIKGIKFDFVVTRAVAPMSKLIQWSRKHVSDKHKNIIPNGIIALKGGNLRAELKEIRKGEYYETIKILDYFKEPFFVEKHIVYFQG
jgi:16S rRNA (guanine527-N7)-methyltransferase